MKSSRTSNILCPASQDSKSSSRKWEMRSLASPVNARHKSIPCLSEGTSVVSTTASVCDDSHASFSQDDFRPIPEAGSCRSTSLVHCVTVTATTTDIHCHVQRTMTTDSSHWHSVDAQYEMPQFHTHAKNQCCPRLELATTAVVDPRSTNPMNGRTRCFPDVHQSDREYSCAASASEEKIEQTDLGLPTKQQVRPLAHSTPALQLDDWARVFGPTCPVFLSLIIR